MAVIFLIVIVCGHLMCGVYSYLHLLIISATRNINYTHIGVGTGYMHVPECLNPPD